MLWTYHVFGSCGSSMSLVVEDTDSIDSNAVVRLRFSPAGYLPL